MGQSQYYYAFCHCRDIAPKLQLSHVIVSCFFLFTLISTQTLLPPSHIPTCGIMARGQKWTVLAIERDKMELEKEMEEGKDSSC